ncbi:uncharacterized protein LOC122510986 [Leptopilina heterotoma]|uniref:uncharacterized protein LOC122510986 n=1 Tax=Leptopilina heterotoma TaxID=63436 RepID=UPI001CAA275C|nr:uncharacterized protein LOC122510986 [Leptopilina heterotoma]
MVVASGNRYDWSAFLWCANRVKIEPDFGETLLLGSCLSCSLLHSFLGVSDDHFVKIVKMEDKDARTAREEKQELLRNLEQQMNTVYGELAEMDDSEELNFEDVLKHEKMADKERMADDMPVTEDGSDNEVDWFLGCNPVEAEEELKLSPDILNRIKF